VPFSDKHGKPPITRSIQHSNSGTKNGYEDFFRYTSGRWLYGERKQLADRYLAFNVQALQQTAGKALGCDCIGVEKLSEGLYNKVFSLRMANGKEILARIPNPNAGHPHYVVASEVATLEFVSRRLVLFPPCLFSN
jgi:hypothetical protein